MLFPLGYEGRLVTESQLLASTLWRGLDPEFARRLLAMMKALGAQGLQYGVGGTLRTYERQRALFLTRHDLVPSGGCCGFENKRWQLKRGLAHAAPPGASYHEDVTPEGRCLAADMVGDHRRAEAIMGQFGLVNFRTVNSEPWHFQPSEIPQSRRRWNAATMWPLKPWPIPGPPTPPIVEDDMARIVRITDPKTGAWAAPGQYVLGGGQIEWIQDMSRRDALIAAGAARLDPSGAPFKIGRDQLRFFRLVGTVPPPETGSTIRADEFLAVAP